MNTPVNALVASILVLNIAVGITVVCLVPGLYNEQRQNLGDSSSQNMKNIIDKVYSELLGNANGEAEDKTNNVGPMNMSSEMLNTLKPIAFFSGLNNNGLVKEGPHRISPARGWADQTMFASDRQVLYNGMKNDHGSISVPIAGVYMVYSHVTFHPNAETDFHHRITRYNAAKQEENTAFQNVDNRHNVSDRDPVLSSDIRGMLLLNAGDQLRVDISGVSPSGYEKDGYYFGLYKI